MICIQWLYMKVFRLTMRTADDFYGILQIALKETCNTHYLYGLTMVFSTLQVCWVIAKKPRWFENSLSDCKIGNLIFSCCCFLSSLL